MKAFRILLILWFFYSCGTTVRVTSDYEKSTDFSTYKTYHYYKDLRSGLSALDQKRLIQAMDSVFASRGYELSETPDFFINIESETFQNSGSAISVGAGGTGGNVGGGVSVGFPVGGNQLSLLLFFDFIDENKKKTIWTATSESRFNPNAVPQKRKQDFTAIAVKLLSAFPPRKN